MIGGGTKMDKYEGFKIDVIPKWLRITMIVCKGFLLLTPFTISSLMLMSNEYSLMWNCIWCLSLLKIIDFADE